MTPGVLAQVQTALARSDYRNAIEPVDASVLEDSSSNGPAGQTMPGPREIQCKVIRNSRLGIWL